MSDDPISAVDNFEGYTECCQASLDGRRVIAILNLPACAKLVPGIDFQKFHAHHFERDELSRFEVTPCWSPETRPPRDGIDVHELDPIQEVQVNQRFHQFCPFRIVHTTRGVALSDHGPLKFFG